MPLQVTRTDSLSEADRQALFSWSDDIWSVNAYRIDWRPKPVHFVARDDAGNPVAHTSVLRFRHDLGSDSVTIGGIGAVFTLPTARGQGHATRTVSAAIDFLRQDWTCDAAMLFCFPRLVSFYERLGFTIHPHPVLILQQRGAAAVPDQHVMRHDFRPIPWPDAPLRLFSRPW